VAETSFYLQITNNPPIKLSDPTPVTAYNQSVFSLEIDVMQIFQDTDVDNGYQMLVSTSADFLIHIGYHTAFQTCFLH